MTYDGPNNGEALHDTQLDVTELRTRGYSIISPGDALSAGAYSVSINTGNLNASDTLTVGTSGDEAVYDGSTVSLSSATNVGISGVNTDPQGNEQYRFDVIWIGSNGEVNKTEGTAGTLATLEEEENLTRFERFSQAIPEPGTWPSPVVAVVVVNSGDSSVTTSQLRDYRVPANIDVNQVNTDIFKATTQSLTGPRTETKEIVGFDSDGDSTSNLSLSISGLSSLNEAQLVVVVEGAGTGNSNPVNIQTNGETTNYEFHTLSGGTITNRTGQSEFFFNIQDDKTRRERFNLTSAGDRVDIHQDTGNPTDKNYIINGSVPSTVGLSSVSISTAFNASGRFYIKNVQDS